MTTVSEAEQVALVKSLIAQARRLGLIWTLRNATVVDGTDPDHVSVRFDGDTKTSFDIVSLTGAIPVGQRVSIASVPPAGQFVLGFLGHSPLPYGIVMRSSHTTASAANTGTETDYVRYDGIPVSPGRGYLFVTNNINLDTNTATTYGHARLRYVENGTAVTASPQLGQGIRIPAQNATFSSIPGGFTQPYYPAAGTTTVSLLITVQAVNTPPGNITLFVNASTPLEVALYDMGDDPGNTASAI